MKYLKKFNEHTEDYFKNYAGDSNINPKSETPSYNTNPRRIPASPIVAESRELDKNLRRAARLGNLDEVKKLLDEGADIAADNYMAFKWATEWMRPEIVEYFLDNCQISPEVIKWSKTLVEHRLGGISTHLSPAHINRAALEKIQELLKNF